MYVPTTSYVPTTLERRVPSQSVIHLPICEFVFCILKMLGRPWSPTTNEERLLHPVGGLRCTFRPHWPFQATYGLGSESCELTPFSQPEPQRRLVCNSMDTPLRAECLPPLFTNYGTHRNSEPWRFVRLRVYQYENQCVHLSDGIRFHRGQEPGAAIVLKPNFIKNKIRPHLSSDHLIIRSVAIFY